jgi:hypothetical protein
MHACVRSGVTWYQDARHAWRYQNTCMGYKDALLPCWWWAAVPTRRVTMHEARGMQVVEQLRKRGDKRQEARGLNCLGLMHSQALNMPKAIAALQR